MKIKTVFFGTPKYCLPYLELIYQIEPLALIAAVTQPDKPTGRGLETAPSPVKQRATSQGVVVLTPTDLGEPDFIQSLKSLKPQLGIMAYYGLKIPQAVIDLFPLGILNIHHSLLPKHRGSNPIPWTILHGETETGTTIIRIGEKFDTGEIVGQSRITVSKDETGESLRPRLDESALQLLAKTLPEYLNGKIIAYPQPTAGGSYDKRITKEDGRIDWRQDAIEIDRKVRAFTPWPGTWTTLEKLKSQKSKVKNMDERRVKIIKTHLSENKNVVIDSLQVEGKKTISWEDFARGYL